MFRADEQNPKTKLWATTCSAPFPKKDQDSAHKYLLQWDAMQQSRPIRRVGVFPWDPALSRWTKIKHSAMTRIVLKNKLQMLEDALIDQMLDSYMTAEVCLGFTIAV